MATATLPSTVVVSADEFDARDAPQHAEHKRKRPHKIMLPDTAATFAQPALPHTMDTTIQQYFTLLKDAVDVSAYSRVDKADMEADGLYLHKRPISGMGSSNKGTVTHHVVLYLKDGAKVHGLDFGPDNGADVTANFMLEHPPRKVLKMDTSIPAEDVLPLMYIGKADLTLDDEGVTQAVQFAEAQNYHAMRNNCIHFADMMIRVLTRGKVRNAPLIYDIVCGEVPAQDPPESIMLAMLGLSWFTICDGSPHTARLLSSLDPTPLQHSLSISDLPSKRQEPGDSSPKAAISAPPANPSIPVLPNPAAGAALLSMLSALQSAQRPDAIPLQNNAGQNLMAVLGMNGVGGPEAGVRVEVNGAGHRTLVESASTDSFQSSDTRDEA